MSSIVYPGALDDFFQVRDNWYTTVAAEASPSATFIFLDSVTGLPSRGLIWIDSELIAYKAINVGLKRLTVYAVANGDNFDGRGFYGTIAATHLVGKTAEIRVSAYDTNLPKDAIQQLEVVTGLAEIVPLDMTQATFAPCGTIFNLDADYRSMVIDYSVEFLLGLTPGPGAFEVYEVGTIRAIRYAANTGTLDVDRMIVDWNGDTVADSGLEFEMDTGAGVTSLNYRILPVLGGSQAHMKARVRKFTTEGVSGI